MPALNRLSAVKVKAAAKPGLIADGGGLYLQVTARLDGGVAKSWIFRFTWHGRERKCGLGTLDAVSLADARQAAAECRAMVAKGVDPIDARRALRAAEAPAKAAAPTFERCAVQYMADHEAGWRSGEHREQWRQSLRDHVYPEIGRLPVDQVDLAAVLRVLKPIWASHAPTAMRVRGRIENILTWARVMRHRTGENPAAWRGNLDQLLPKPGKLHSVKHHDALPYREVPAFVAALRAMPGVTPLAVEFAILTCARAGEVRGAQWDEMDMDGKVWTVPSERMKGGKEHRVPLSARCVEILETLARTRHSDFVFPGRAGGLTKSVLLNATKELRRDVTLHGFRSSFRDWAAETTNAPREVCEQCLAHATGNAVEDAYRRTDILEKRRALLAQWAQYIETPPAGNVVPLRANEARA